MGVVRGVVYIYLGHDMWVWLYGPRSHFGKVEAYALCDV